MADKTIVTTKGPTDYNGELDGVDDLAAAYPSAMGRATCRVSPQTTP
jgi:hypothetical protein